MARTAIFGEQRLVRLDASTAEKMLFKVLGVADPANFLHYRYFRLATRHLASSFKPKRILDAGCGRGDFSFYLARLFPTAEVVGIDLNVNAIDQNSAVCKTLGLHNLHFQVASILDFSSADHFDFVVCVDVLEHIAKQEEAFHRLAGLLSESGYAYYHIPTIRKRPVPFSGMLSDFQEWAHTEHVAKERTTEEFRGLVESSGLSLIYCVATFGYYTGELANSLFVMPYKNSPLNRLLQAAVSPLCRLLALMDPLMLERERYAVALLSRKIVGK